MIPYTGGIYKIRILQGTKIIYDMLFKWLSVLHLALMPRIRVIPMDIIRAEYELTHIILWQKPTGSAIGCL
jgi:hypothetical protein